MMRLKFKIFCIGLLISLLLYSNSYAGEKTQYSRTFEQEFSVKPNATLDIINKYGNVHVTSWDKNVISVHVEISVEAASLAKANEILGHIEIYPCASEELVNISTQISDMIPEQLNKELQIDYTVIMPSTNNLSLINKFGDVYVNELSGIADLYLSYGHLKLDRLYNEANLIFLSFIDGSIINLTGGKLEVKYSKLTVNNASNLYMDSKFSELNIIKADKFESTAQSDEFNIGYVNDLSLKGKFSNYTVSNVSNSFSTDFSYSYCTVNNISSYFKNINIKAEVSDIKMNFDPDASFQLEADFEFGKIIVPENSNTVLKKTEGKEAYTMAGTVGSNKSPKSQMRIKSMYGDVNMGFN